jgi:hypothetical protein
MTSYYPPTVNFPNINFNNDFFANPNNNQGITLAYANTHYLFSTGVANSSAISTFFSGGVGIGVASGTAGSLNAITVNANELQIKNVNVSNIFITSNVLGDVLTPYISSNVLSNVLSPYDTIALRTTAINNLSNLYISSNDLSNVLTPYDTIALRTTAISNLSNNLISTSNGIISVIDNTSNTINNNLNATNISLSNLRDNLYLFDETFTANLDNHYCKKHTFLIQTNTLTIYNSVNYYTYTIDLTKYIKYLQVSQYTKQARFKITASLASSIAVFEYLTECEYKMFMSDSSTIGQTGGFHCRAFGIPEDLNLTKFAPYKFIKTNNIYQLTFLSAVVGAKFLITIIDEF